MYRGALPTSKGPGRAQATGWLPAQSKSVPSGSLVQALNHCRPPLGVGTTGAASTCRFLVLTKSGAAFPKPRF